LFNFSLRFVGSNPWSVEQHVGTAGRNTRYGEQDWRHLFANWNHVWKTKILWPALGESWVETG